MAFGKLSCSYRMVGTVDVEDEREIMDVDYGLGEIEIYFLSKHRNILLKHREGQRDGRMDDRWID